MLTATLCVTTPNLLIKKSLNELVQAAIYKHLPSCEHDGHTGKGGKKFKKSVFRAIYDDNAVELKFASMDKEYEESVAKAMLKDEFRIGAVHISNAYVGVEHRSAKGQSRIEAEGYVCVHVNDQNGKRLYLEPRDSRFVEIISKNLSEKYETLLGEPLDGGVKIKTLWQAEKPTIICYKAARHKVYKARYEIEADEKALNLALDTGLGSKIMQGCGWIGVVENATSAKRGVNG